MNEFKGTKGRWHFRKNGDNLIKILGKKEKKVCSINCNLNNRLDDVNLANAKLITAAPILLNALIGLHSFSAKNHPQGSDEYDSNKHEKLLKNAYQAIQKALK